MRQLVVRARKRCCKSPHAWLIKSVVASQLEALKALVRTFERSRNGLQAFGTRLRVLQVEFDELVLVLLDGLGKRLHAFPSQRIGG